MGMEFEVNSLEDMCALMCDNVIPRRKEFMITAKVNNLPSKKYSGYMVARIDYSSGRPQLWYYGTYDTKERADEVAMELGNGITLEARYDS